MGKAEISQGLCGVFSVVCTLDSVLSGINHFFAIATFKTWARTRQTATRQWAPTGRRSVDIFMRIVCATQ